MSYRDAVKAQNEPKRQRTTEDFLKGDMDKTTPVQPFHEAEAEKAKQ